MNINELFFAQKRGHICFMIEIVSHGLHWQNRAFNSFEEDELFSEKDIDDLKDTKGLYILEYNFKVLYIGKAENSILRRLQKHNKNHHKNRWNMVSWFEIKFEGTDADFKTELTKIEALCIAMVQPKLNGQTKSKHLGNGKPQTK